MESPVEEHALRHSGEPLKIPPTEKTGIIIVDNFPQLGKLAALRFIEWVQRNPEGVISLPTGKTPEYFIKETERYLKSWENRETRKELEEAGIDPGVKPDMSRLAFVQIDEFYPIDPSQHNSFYHYVNRFYIDKFRLDPKRAMLINCNNIALPHGKNLTDIWPENEVDISLRYRKARNNQERLQKYLLEGIDQWCIEYEEKIRNLGGIGFFLGGIGPDGHIGFNVKGSDFHSTTRLAQTNYETQAAAASDLGGIEVARKRLVITIGLATITYNPKCTAIIIAAGDAKARVVADAIQNEMHIRYPATVLQKLKNARFYLTKGAAKLLTERNRRRLSRFSEIPGEEIQKTIIDLSLKLKKPIDTLKPEDFKGDEIASILAEKYPEGLSNLIEETRKGIEEKITLGSIVEGNKVFLHTEPHHDDLMLGYLPYIVRHIREHSTTHYFATLTSGFTAVTNSFMLEKMRRLNVYLKKHRFDELFSKGYFRPENVEGKNRDVWQYLDGVAADSYFMREEGELRRLLRNMVFIYREYDLEKLEKKTDYLIDYFETQYPGKKDIYEVQMLKGMTREWEADCLWGYFGWHSDSIFHLRLGFYKGDIFTEEPTLEGDVKPTLELLKKTNPDVVTVALDPEASGPDTHYKVLQAITEALKLYSKETGRSDIEIIGYRNVWYRFHPAEADLYVPVSLNMFALQNNAFLNSFSTQRQASFPSYEHDGPFCELAQKIQVEQYQMLKTCLGRKFFNNHPKALIRGTRGMVFIKRMNLEELYSYSRELKKGIENL